MNTVDVRAAVESLGVWKKAGQRAPHKPLLVLLALGRAQRGEERLAAFEEVEPVLARLLAEFGPPRQSHHPEYPFWWLRTDGLWEVPGAEELRIRKSGGNPSASELRRTHASGGFTNDVHELFQSPDLRAEIACYLLDTHFPQSLHTDILTATGLDVRLATAATKRPRRDPRFRTEVVRAYEYRCAVCGFDVRLGNELVALEAAHIKWVAALGPDIVSNGLALCAIHHKALDRGAMGLDEDLRVQVSADVNGTGAIGRWFLDFVGEPIRPPQDRDLAPNREFVRWHRCEVFREPARTGAGA